MLNRVILVGRITKSPELKSTQNNINFVQFTLAVNRQFADQSGERQADFIQCVVWRRQAENVAQYVHKGDLLGIDGRLQTRSYEVDGQTRYATEVVCDSVQFLETKEKKTVVLENVDTKPEVKIPSGDEALPF
jgi:single-strand DNA-binding protein